MPPHPAMTFVALPAAVRSVLSTCLLQPLRAMPASITLKSPLPAKDLMFESMTASEGLSMLGEIQLALVSEKADLKPEDLLGKPMTVSVALPDDKQRHFHGYVTRFAIGAHRGRFFGYHVNVRPWLWFLTRTADCRIFQDQSVPEIVKKVFEDHSNANFEDKTFRSYRKWVYCVQYRETDYNFIARILEHEGIYWYVEHGDGTSKVVLVDSQSAHDAVPGYESLPFYEDAPGSSPDTEYISDWHFESEVETDKVALTSYDFERPSTNLKADAKKSHKYSLPEFEMFDFQGDYVQVDDGTQWAEDRLDEHQARFEVAHGSSNAHGIEVGRLLELSKHPRADQNDQYLITAISVNARVDAYESGGSAGAFRCDFSAIPSAQQFRPPRRTPKPFVQGPQTAVVVGPDGEEIFTDKYGRVKVQFHWDRLGKKDEKSSCWVRVSHPWAGKNFGAIHIPRIGQEVVVDFLEGDPDQPLITGRVYNAEQMPPWELPANATQSGIHTRSSKGGAYGNANTLRFEDKKGAEQVLIHAEKDMSTSVENDQSTSVGHDQSTSVKNSQTTTVEKGRKVFVKSKGETYYVKDDRKIYVDAKQEYTVTKDSDTWVNQNMAEYVTGDRKAVTQGKWIFKSTEAHFDAGPKWFATASDVQVMSLLKTTLQAGTDFSLRATDFKFSATNNINFTGNQFNRTIFEGNDTVLGNNTSTYIGSSRSTTMGPSVEVYSGMKNATNVGIASEASLAINVSNFIGLAISNALALSIENSGINMGMTGVDLGMAGIGLDNNGLKMLNGGGAGAPAGAGLGSAPAGIAALMASAVGLGLGAGFGGAAAVDASSQGEADVQSLLNNPDLTPAMRARLQQAMDHRFQHSKAESGPTDSSKDAVMSGQLSSLADAASPAIDPAGSPAASATAPLSPADPSAAP